MRVLTSIIAISALFGFSGLLAIVGGLLLGYWHQGRQRESEDVQMGFCDTCRYSDNEWDEHPCDVCSDDASRWEDRQCYNCKHEKLSWDEEPCDVCTGSDFRWEAKEDQND